MADEKDLIIGTESEEAEMEPDYDFYEDRNSTRLDIDTAIAVWNFIEEIDVNGPTVLNMKMKQEVMRTQKNCLKIICDSIELMAYKD